MVKKIQTADRVFEGEIDNNGIANGKGKFEYIGGFNNGDKYIGEFKDGLPHGEGEYIWSHGKKYVGQFTEGQITGKGVMTYLENHSELAGDRWEGLFKDGFPDIDDKNFKMIKAKKKIKKTKSQKFESEIWQEVLDKQLKKVNNKKIKKKITWEEIEDDFLSVALKKVKNIKVKKKKK